MPLWFFEAVEGVTESSPAPCMAKEDKGGAASGYGGTYSRGVFWEVEMEQKRKKWESGNPDPICPVGDERADPPTQREGRKVLS